MDEARARDVVLRGMLSAVREGRNASWCKSHLVKPLRRLLKPPPDASHIGPNMERARAEAEASLRKFCNSCTLPHCKGKSAPSEIEKLIARSPES